MKIFSADQPLNRAAAMNCLLVNQFATPGLGSLMGRRIAAGIGQLSLAIAGFILVIFWFFMTMIQYYGQISSDAPTVKSYALYGIAGGCLFFISWLWAWVTSLSLLHQARNDPG